MCCSLSHTRQGPVVSVVRLLLTFYAVSLVVGVIGGKREFGVVEASLLAVGLVQPHCPHACMVSHACRKPRPITIKHVPTWWLPQLPKRETWGEL